MSNTANEVPFFEVDINGNKCSQDEPKGMQRLVVETHVDMIGVAEVTIGMEEEWNYNIGDTVKIKVGGSDQEVFYGYITGYRHHFSKGAVNVTIIAMDPLIKLTASRRTQIWEESKDSDAVSKVIGDSGESAGTVDSTDATHKYIFQRNESDLNFLKRMAARNGCLVQATHEGKIEFKAPQASGDGEEVDHEKVVLLDFTLSDMNVPPKVKVIGWDYVAKEEVFHEASSVETTGGGATGVSEATTWQDTYYISDVLVSDGTAASPMATGELERLGRTFLRGRLVVEGNGALKAGGKVNVTGMRTGYNPHGIIVSARHVIEIEGGFTTEVNFVGNSKPE